MKLKLACTRLVPGRLSKIWPHKMLKPLMFHSAWLLSLARVQCRHRSGPHALISHVGIKRYMVSDFPFQCGVTLFFQQSCPKAGADLD